MAKINLKKILTAACLSVVVAFSAAASACSLETKHPKAEITFEFNSQEYVVEYTMYRNMYPQTVKHFIELAENGFYDNTVIHNYEGTDWFAGGYTYVAEEYSAAIESESIDEYLETHSKEQAYLDLFNDGKLTPSVYSGFDYEKDKDGKDVLDGDNNPVPVFNDNYALPTLIGEFENNVHRKIDNGALVDDFGCLKMFYYSKEANKVCVRVDGYSQPVLADYKNNCATSLFSIQVGSGSAYGSANYCVFAKGDTDALEDLKEAITTYFNDASVTVSANVNVDTLEPFSKEEKDRNVEKRFSVPKTAVVVKSVKITKY